jgi:hypothetical protein
MSARYSGGVVSVSVVTGGTGYTVAPTVAFSGGGGTNAAALAHMAGTVVQSVVLTTGGTGYSSAPTVTLSAATGSGASAAAAVYAGLARPMTFFQGRSGEAYGVDGMGRGVRIDCGTTALTPVGIHRPSVAPVITASTTSAGKYVSEIIMIRPGAGYNATPSVTLTGGSATTAATARAVMRAGAVAGVVVEGRGDGYATPPAVTIVGGFPSSPTFGVEVSGGVAEVRILAGGTGYTSSAATTPTIVFSSGRGLTNAYAVPSVDSLGRISGLQRFAGGTGATTSVTAEVTGGGGSSAIIAIDMQFSVVGATVISGGTGHQVPPVLTFTPNKADTSGGGGIAEATVSAGAVTSVAIKAGGAYSLPPTLGMTDTSAEALAVLAPVLQGTYRCAVRYLDGGKGDDPIPSSISDLTTVEVPDGASNLAWSFTHAGIDARVTAMELWRTTANQSIVLYRVATIARDASGWTSGYVDTRSDPDLLDPDLPGYGLMPITLPSGQLNARRFGVPPGNYGVAVMFQDRAWLGVDTTGVKPNSLLFSEVDEPESVPEENELVIQESAGEQDQLVAMIPLGSELLLVQTGHTYSLRYVAQPVIDASISLVAYRGVLSNRCWAVMGGVAFMVDSYGLYAFDGRSEKAVSAAVDNYWRDRIIDFSKSDLFHVSADYTDKVVRFHYCQSSDSTPIRALCYCVATDAWWEEVYPTALTASAPVVIAGRRGQAFGTGAGGFVRTGASSVSWQYQSGNYRLSNDPDRSIGVVFDPTATTCPLNLSLHFNGSTSARANAVASDRGGGFITGTTAATVDMRTARSPLGDATGYAQAHMAGRLDPRSVGADRHVAIALAGTQNADRVAIHGVTISGAG